MWDVVARVRDVGVQARLGLFGRDPVRPEGAIGNDYQMEKWMVIW